MFVMPVKNGNMNPSDLKYKPAFMHKKSSDNNITPIQKAIIATSSSLGVIAALAILSKCATKNINPFKGGKNSYFSKVKYGPKEIISIATGSVTGGLLAGCAIDKNKENRKSKIREGLLQIGNASIPILTVSLAVDKICHNANKYIKAIAGLGGVFAGVALANFIMNKINNKIFNNNDGRGVRFTDYSAHIDDLVVAAQYITDAKIVHIIGRLIPLALTVPGIETGKKQAEKI